MQTNTPKFQYQVTCNPCLIVLIKWTEYLWTGLMFSVDFKLHCLFQSSKTVFALEYENLWILLKWEIK